MFYVVINLVSLVCFSVILSGRTLQWVRSAAPIIIHINLDKVLRFLVKDAHYRNQFETGTSGGSTDLVARRSWEVRVDAKLAMFTADRFQTHPVQKSVYIRLLFPRDRS